MIAITADGLIKRFREVQAVADVSFVLHGAFNASNAMLFALDFCVVGGFCIFLFAWSPHNIRRRWIL